MTVLQSNVPQVGASSEHVRVLLVDDDERWAQVTGRLLSERESFTVETAHRECGSASSQCTRPTGGQSPAARSRPGTPR
ncbi:hypothetical protein BRC61_06980 [Halobacteriales archaeon QH_10_65_19]|nr:MAG: hypothetical protein BRC61_06980 [Halobacteriales archaeon QH_10_65_19]